MVVPWPPCSTIGAVLHLAVHVPGEGPPALNKCRQVPVGWVMQRSVVDFIRPRSWTEATAAARRFALGAGENGVPRPTTRVNAQESGSPVGGPGCIMGE